MASFGRRLKNSYADLERIQSEAAAFLHTAGFSPDTLRTVNVALDETISNILKYGYEDDAEHEIEVAIVSSQARIALTVIDDGKEFNPLKYMAACPDLPLEQREPGRLGIRILRELFDDVTYRREDLRNHLTLQKRFGAAP